MWESVEKSVIAGDAAALERLLRDNPALQRAAQAPPYAPRGPFPRYDDGGAREIIAREHQFESWEAFETHREAVSRADSPVSRFEAAVEATIAGDVPALEQLLRRDPDLIRARSARMHRATLLHYVGANGVEGFRQKTPKNAVHAARALLAAGAEVDAVAQLYGGSTTLGLAATSIHPLLAGVQNALLDALLEAGADIDHPQGAGNGQPPVNGCLANGRALAAEFLAARGARLDLEAAAGVGRLDVVEMHLKSGPPEAQLKSGFNWACAYGRTRVVEHLLQRGIDVGALHRGETGLHWAAHGGHPGIVRLLLERGAPLESEDETWGATPLGWALHGFGHPVPESAAARHAEVVALLVAAGALVDPDWLELEQVRADPRMRAALRGEMPGS